MLPTYPPTFILAGAAGAWLVGRSRAAGALVALCAAAFAWESLAIRPHYLSYFNQLAGGPGNGYRHLVDSSLDWGQDLPRLATLIDRLRAAEGGEAPVYLAYFGAAPPEVYGIEARWLLSFFPTGHPHRPPVEMTGGIYCVSVTLLQSLHTDLLGPWNGEREAAYRRHRELVASFSGPAGARSSRPHTEWVSLFREHERLASARLFGYLRRREPDARAGYSIHAYRLSDADVDEALHGPPPDRWEKTSPPGKGSPEGQ